LCGANAISDEGDEVVSTYLPKGWLEVSKQYIRLFAESVAIDLFITSNVTKHACCFVAR